MSSNSTILVLPLIFSASATSRQFTYEVQAEALPRWRGPLPSPRSQSFTLSLSFCSQYTYKSELGSGFIAVKPFAPLSHPPTFCWQALSTEPKMRSRLSFGSCPPSSSNFLARNRRFISGTDDEADAVHMNNSKNHFTNIPYTYFCFLFP